MTTAEPRLSEQASSVFARIAVGRWPGILFALLFVVEGLLLIPYVGLQNDELRFGGGIYPPWGVVHVFRLGGHTFPTMLVSYAGTLKAWIYRLLVFPVWPPGSWSVRLPMVLIGAATVWMFSELVRRTCGPRTALVAAALLATDVTYVLTTTFDWGPVALQHLFLLAGATAFWLFHRRGNLLYLAGGALVFGLALWDKAVFSWSLAGLAVATAAVFPRAMLAKLTARNLAVAAAGLALGAAPLLLYNRDTSLETFRGNARMSTAQFGHKLHVLKISLDGSALFGYITPRGAVAAPHAAANAGERLSLALSGVTGHRRSGVLAWGVLLAFAVMPWLWNTPARKPMLFSLTFMAVTWLQMALSHNGGGGAHHTVLLWPFPHLFVAAALAQASLRFRRGAAAALLAATALVCASNLLVLNEYLTQVIRAGTTVLWTDAIDPLSAYLRDVKTTHVYVMDWGILDNLRALHRGTLPLEDGPTAFLTGGNEKLPPEMLARDGALFLGHTRGNEIDRGMAARLEALGRSAGLVKQVTKVIADRNGRPVFEAYRFTR